MAMTSDSGGGGGNILAGTAGSICAISPSDTVGTIGNLITRIEELEKAVSSILGADLFTERLSNLSEQVGWVYGVEYMGVPGWIQTEYGTLIPPPGFTLSGSGFTLSDGNTYHAVVMDENGVLQYGFTDDGQITGAVAHHYDHYVYALGETVTTITPSQDYGVGVTIIDNDLDVETALKPLNSITFRVDRDGAYYCSISARGQISSTTGTAFPYVDLSILSTGGGTASDMLLSAKEEADDTTRSSANLSNLVRLEAGQEVRMGANVGEYGGGSSAFRHLTRVRASIVWIAPLV